MTRTRTPLCRDARGVTVLEFGIVMPVMAILMMGLGDLGYQMYVKELLTGSVQKAARDAGIQGGAQQTAAIDDKVLSMIGNIMRKPTESCSPSPAVGTFCSTRLAYASFSAVGPERFEDGNGNNQRDPGECYIDVNGNSQWDAEPGRAGQGGANDVALYTISITYARIFPFAGMIGATPNQTVTVQTVLKNQPYATQAASAAARRCN